MFMKRSFLQAPQPEPPIGAPAPKKAKPPQPPSVPPPPGMLKMPQELADQATAELKDLYVDSVVINVDDYDVKPEDHSIIKELGYSKVEAMDIMQGVYWTVGVHLDRPCFKQVTADNPLYLFWVNGSDGGWYLADRLFDNAATADKNVVIVERANYNQFNVVKHVNDIQHNSA